MSEQEHGRPVTVQEASRRLGIDSRMLRAAIDSGDLDAFKPGARACYVRWPDVLRWLSHRRMGAVQ